MPALIRYQTALLVRSQRWLPPVLLYAALLAVGVQSGQPLLDSLGLAAAAILPVAAWLVRICVTGEPPAARHCAGAAAGPWRVHLASVLTALGAASVLAAAGTAVAAAISDPHSTNRLTEVPVAPAALAGLLAALVCALLGTAIGTLCGRPVLRSTGVAVPSMLLAALMVLVVGGSPANAAVDGLVTGSRSGTVHMPWVPFAASAGVLALAVWAACVLAARRT
ncbi:ABC transporter [Streptomyces sp. NPDC054796]